MSDVSVDPVQTFRHPPSPEARVDEAVRRGLWWSDGDRSVRGAGEVTVQEVAAAQAGEAIRRAVADGAPGAFFTAGFEPDVPTRLLIPDTLDVGPAHTLVPVPPSGGSPSEIVVHADAPAEAWGARVAAAVEDLGAPGSELAKVILTRHLSVRADRDLDPRAVLGRLAGSFPRAFLYSVGGIVGASPEMLGQVIGGRFSARALAGTIGRSPDPDADAEAALALLRSAKDRHEHRLLTAYLAERLQPAVEDLTWADEPSLLTLSNVHHLMTEYHGRLRSGPGSLVDLVASIHPTPAVSGFPQADALEWIRTHEPRRGRLHGYVGWCDGRGDGQAALAIRSLEIDGPAARLVVGNGIVAESSPLAEVLEVQAKARGVLDAVTAI